MNSRSHQQGLPGAKNGVVKPMTLKSFAQSFKKWNQIRHQKTLHAMQLPAALLA